MKEDLQTASQKREERGPNASRPRFAERLTPPFATNEPSIDALDLSPIKFKIHKENGGGRTWTVAELERTEDLYRAFLALHKKHPETPLVPSEAIDVFWHQHILDTHKYERDCQSMFGAFFHHFPYLGIRGSADAELLALKGENTYQLLRSEYPQLGLSEYKAAASWFDGGCD